jgi:putative PIN family toxin of toxin-antitoxin system
VFHDSNVSIFLCEKLIREVNSTLLKPKLHKYISAERQQALLEIMASRSLVSIHEQTFRSRDPKDNYLLDLAETINADYLVTGDNDLLVLKHHIGTVIVSMNEFLLILGF